MNEASKMMKNLKLLCKPFMLIGFGLIAVSVLISDLYGKVDLVGYLFNAGLAIALVGILIGLFSVE